jgi:hypothetical protein
MKLRGSDGLSDGCGALIRAGNEANTKIPDHWCAVIPQENVRRLNVTVYHARLVSVPHAEADLLKKTEPLNQR